MSQMIFNFDGTLRTTVGHIIPYRAKVPVYIPPNAEHVALMEGAQYCAAAVESVPAPAPAPQELPEPISPPPAPKSRKRVRKDLEDSGAE